ncbi:hypothetical protein AZF37_00245 [endosymbiont 'TC1' of Trimyema compressum]|uniref:ATP-binding cassette domain-containing protein n=1 Tax=endosymbiont 'TC1' of Trimyema compressum TaxID=243899 RepID=UPI0007F0AA82|nr:ATP-binding cassette domain-containing protein [endosymbiont 'TC1' of Trimyema compressum]AMP19812.1 hypothetical protein AZF37_00245 [endosymbiont 'TC1' of Trimyema compressum]
MKQRMDYKVKSLCIENLMNRNIFTFSGGEKQMLSIASAYAMGSDIFVLDEPTANLDSFATEQLAIMIDRLKKKAKPLLYVSIGFIFKRFSR